MSTKSIFFGILLLISGIVKAGVVDTTTARLIGKNFIYEKINIDEKAGYSSINLQYLSKEEGNNLPVFYIYNIKDRPGFVIVSAEDATTPILGYSYETDFDINKEQAPAFIGWMNHYKEQINYIRQNNIIADKKIKQLWTKYSTKPFLSKAGQPKDVSPLLTTTWNQGTYYNQLCPADAGGQDGHVWTGCVATAMAQVMKFWNYPDYGSDNHTYNHWNYGLQTADFANTFYNWAAMPNALSSYNTPVATLMYHCGVSVDMDYSTSGSGAYSSSAASALKRFFDFSYTLYLASKNGNVDTVWRDLIKGELDLGHPLYYSGNPSSGGGHAWVCDGYQGIDYFHMNWGWGGSDNGYFYLDDLTPGSYDFTYNQQAIINCYPDCQNPQCNGITTVSDASGTLTDGSPTGGYLTNYSNCSDCEYLIQPTGTSSVFINFDNFSTIEGEDSLYVYDGADDTAPLLYALSGDTVPDSFFSSTGSVYFHFVSDNFRTAPGWQVSYTTAFDDVGVTSIYLPQTKTCGEVLDTVQVIIGNFGANTETNIPVVADVLTPSGPVSINTTYPGPLARNDWATVVIGTINTTNPGNYQVTAYTNLTGDTVINSNDTAYSDFDTKTIISVPHAEIFDDLQGQPGDWVDRNWAAFPDYEVSGTDTNYLMRGWIDQWMTMFLVFERKIENITANTNLRFDYRFLKAGGTWPPTDSIVLDSSEKMHIVISTDCGATFDTIFTIDTLNHVNTSDFATKEVSLGAYAGNDIIIGFVTQWDDSMAIVDIDNVIILDNITNNNIAQNQIVCETDTPVDLTGNTTTGGIGSYTYLWQESSDDIFWTDATGTNNLETYSPSFMTDTMYYKRIVSDTLVYTDTSNVISVIKVSNPTVNIQGSTTECGSTVLDEGVGMPGDSYFWSTGDTTQTITVNTSGNYALTVTDGNGCSGADTVAVTIYDIPVVNLGIDTIICAGDSILLNAGIYDTYLWSTGETTQTIVVDTNGTGLSTTAVYVQVTDSNSCVNNDTINLTFNICMGLENNYEGAIKIYPNPTKGFVTIEGKQISEINIINVTGQTIKKIAVQNVINDIDLSSLSKGIYFVKIAICNKTIVKKIVLE